MAIEAFLSASSTRSDGPFSRLTERKSTSQLETGALFHMCELGNHVSP